METFFFVEASHLLMADVSIIDGAAITALGAVLSALIANSDKVTALFKKAH
jgi:hypothetical protein